MESSKATVRHIRQVAAYPEAAQINILCHQHTELPPGKHKKRKPVVKQRQPHPKNTEKQLSSHPNMGTRLQIDAPGLVILFIIKRDSNAHQKSSSASHATSMVTIQASVTKKPEQVTSLQS